MLQAAEEIHNTLLKKFKSNTSVWINFGLFYYKTDQADAARALLQRSFKSLDKQTRQYMQISIPVSLLLNYPKSFFIPM